MSYLDIGITNGSTVVVEIRSDVRFILAYKNRMGKAQKHLVLIMTWKQVIGFLFFFYFVVLKRLMIVYNEEGIQKCLSLYKNQYMEDDDNASLLNFLQKSIPLSMVYFIYG